MTNRDEMVTSLRSYLRRLAQRRSDRIVTADDAHEYLNKMNVSQKKVRTRLSLINSAFSGDTFYAVGTTPSSREAAKGRQITEWTLA